MIVEWGSPNLSGGVNVGRLMQFVRSPAGDVWAIVAVQQSQVPGTPRPARFVQVLMEELRIKGTSLPLV